MGAHHDTPPAAAKKPQTKPSSSNKKTTISSDDEIQAAPVVFKVKPQCVKLKGSASAANLQMAKETFSLKNFNTPGSKVPISALKDYTTPSMQTMSVSSIDLRGPPLDPNPYTSDYKTLEPVRVPHISIRDAIKLNDHQRIRRGSPGSCSLGAKSAGRTGSAGFTNDYVSASKLKTIDHCQNGSSSKKSFDEEMQRNGIATEIKDLCRFNYVLLTRSSPTHA